MNLLNLPVDIFTSIIRSYENINVNDISKYLMLIALYEWKNKIKIYQDNLNEITLHKSYFSDELDEFINFCSSNQNFEISISRLNYEDSFSDNRDYYTTLYLMPNMIYNLSMFPNLIKAKVKFYQPINREFFIELANHDKITDVKFYYNTRFRVFNIDYLNILYMKNIYLKIYIDNDSLYTDNEIDEIIALYEQNRNIKICIRFKDCYLINNKLKPFVDKITFKLSYKIPYINAISYIKCENIKVVNFDLHFLRSHSIFISNCPELRILYLELYADNINIYLEDVPKLLVIIYYTNISIIRKKNVNNNIILHKIKKINIIEYIHD